MSDWEKLETIAELQQALAAVQRLIIERQTQTRFDNEIIISNLQDVQKAYRDFERGIYFPEMEK